MSPHLPGLLVDLALAGTLAAIANIDVRRHRIPDLLSLPLIGAGLVWAALHAEAWAAHALGAAIGFASLAGFGALYFRWRGREGLGLGDAKLFAAAGAWLGWSALPLVLSIAALGGLSFALLTGRTHAGRALAFGPWLAAGFWAAWLAAGGSPAGAAVRGMLAAF